MMAVLGSTIIIHLLLIVMKYCGARPSGAPKQSLSYILNDVNAQQAPIVADAPILPEDKTIDKGPKIRQRPLQSASYAQDFLPSIDKAEELTDTDPLKKYLSYLGNPLYYGFDESKTESIGTLDENSKGYMQGAKMREEEDRSQPVLPHLSEYGSIKKAYGHHILPYFLGRAFGLKEIGKLAEALIPKVSQDGIYETFDLCDYSKGFIKGYLDMQIVNPDEYDDLFLKGYVTAVVNHIKNVSQEQRHSEKQLIRIMWHDDLILALKESNCGKVAQLTEKTEVEVNKRHYSILEERLLTLMTHIAPKVNNSDGGRFWTIHEKIMLLQARKDEKSYSEIQKMFRNQKNPRKIEKATVANQNWTMIKKLHEYLYRISVEDCWQRRRANREKRRKVHKNPDEWNTFISKRPKLSSKSPE